MRLKTFPQNCSAFQEILWYIHFDAVQSLWRPKNIQDINLHLLLDNIVQNVVLNLSMFTKCKLEHLRGSNHNI